MTTPTNTSTGDHNGPILELRAVRRRFGEGETAVEAVRPVDLTVEPGEIVLIMGPSGSGKTTLLTMIGGLLRPTDGSVLLLGRDLARMSERDLPPVRARHLGFIFQDFNLMPSLSARQNVEIAMNLAGVRGPRARTRAAVLLQRLGLGERLDFLPEELSGGEKQRVAIARALANEPALLLADEPTANLDSGNGRQVMRELRRIAKEEGRSAIIVSHDARLKEIADRVLWLEDGAFSGQDTLVIDPVCGMAIGRDRAQHSLLVDGTEVFFCCDGCRREYDSSAAAGARQRRRSQDPHISRIASSHARAKLRSPPLDRKDPS